MTLSVQRYASQRSWERSRLTGNAPVAFVTSDIGCFDYRSRRLRGPDLRLRARPVGVPGRAEPRPATGTATRRQRQVEPCPVAESSSETAHDRAQRAGHRGQVSPERQGAHSSDRERAEEHCQQGDAYPFLLQKEARRDRVLVGSADRRRQTVPPRVTIGTKHSPVGRLRLLISLFRPPGAVEEHPRSHPGAAAQ